MRKHIICFLTVITVGLLCGCSAKEDATSKDNKNSVSEIENQTSETENAQQNIEETSNTDKKESTEETADVSVVEAYVWEQIPELEYFATYIDKKTDGEAFLIVEVNDCREIIINDITENCYMIYVGEQRFEHRANWEWFYVKEDLSEIFWYNLVDDEMCSMENWRNTPSYINFMSEELN